MIQTIETTETKVNRLSRPDRHTLSIRTKNEPGVLMRICQVFARRAFNIDSLVVAEGRDNRFARMTIGVTGAREGLEQIIKQVNKLVDVIHCYEHTSDDSVAKEMILAKFLVPKEERTDAINIIEHFDGKTIDLTHTSMIAMIIGESAIIDSALEMLSQFEVIETVRTGQVVMARGEQLT
jgi:acetolactate synthase-1/3 small subunit